MARFKKLAVLVLCTALLSGCRSAELRTVEFITPQGVLAHALYRAPSASKTPVPAVIYNHGRLIHGDDVVLSAALGYDVSDFVDQLADDGYAAIAPIRDPKNGSDENYDLLEGALLFLKKQRAVDTERIGIMGFSLGGAPAYRAAAYLDGVKCLILISPRIPPEEAEDSVESIRVPILILYGKKDLESVIETADRILIPTLMAQNKKFKVLHDFDVRHRWFMRVHIAYWQEVSKFLEKYLK